MPIAAQHRQPNQPHCELERQPTRLALARAGLSKAPPIFAGSTAGSTAPQLLFQAIGSGDLRPFVQGQDDVRRAASCAINRSVAVAAWVGSIPAPIAIPGFARVSAGRTLLPISVNERPEFWSGPSTCS
jgi:hypothetical protein